MGRGVARNLLRGNKTGSGDGSPPAGSRGRALVGVWGRSPQKPEECYAMRLIKTTYEEKKTSPYRLTLYIMTISIS